MKEPWYVIFIATDCHGITRHIRAVPCLSDAITTPRAKPQLQVMVLLSSKTILQTCFVRRTLAFIVLFTSFAHLLSFFPTALPFNESVLNIVECGFLTNPGEEALLLDPDYQKQLAAVLAGAWLTAP